MNDRRTHWRELSGTQRRVLLASAAVQVGLAAMAWTDLARREPARIRGSKRAWAWVIAVNFVGPVAYWRFGRHG